jgi:RNA polymerase sigma-70 factor (ECF subfamily)
MTPGTGQSLSDPDSTTWPGGLSSSQAAVRARATQELRAFLESAARFELARQPLASRDRESLAAVAAGAALTAVLADLGKFRGASRFTTWAAKYAICEAGARHLRP